METFVQVLLAVLLIGTVAAALLFWEKILLWAHKTLFPWINKNLPGLKDDVRYAFVRLDNVVTPIRNKIKALENLTDIKKAWEKLREHLLKVLVEFHLNTRSQWVKQTTAWVIRHVEFKQVASGVTEIVDDSPIRTLQSNKPEVVRLVKEEIVDVDSLPDDVRKEWLKRGNTTQDMDVTQLRERELDEYERELLAMTN
ncbi:hypothetical protein [Nostoc commune]|uniref:hypothetical protein n=1 Tax=Nostoc commune TaxID=1178 RepID=UPI0018C46E97|nr:hypothetical protein [Nostoc commune]MBG1260611.1 hypothetical protein [Nostoc commune BAE]